MHLSTQRKHIYDPVKHPNILSDIRCFLLNSLPLSFFVFNGNFEEVFRSCAFNFEKIEFSLRLSMILLKKNGIHSMQGWTATTRHGVTRKRRIERLKHTANLFRRNLQLIGVW